MVWDQVLKNFVHVWQRGQELPYYQQDSDIIQDGVVLFVVLVHLEAHGSSLLPKRCFFSLFFLL